jgi:hypothetical protein
MLVAVVAVAMTLSLFVTTSFFSEIGVLDRDILSVTDVTAPTRVIGWHRYSWDTEEPKRMHSIRYMIPATLKVG